MPKINANAGLASSYAGQPINPLMVGVDPTQYLQGMDPNDPLARALALGDNHPVYSKAQGIADVASKLGEAYLDKKAQQHMVQQQQAAYQAFNQADQTATNTGLAQSLAGGVPLNVQNGQATTMSPGAGQPVGPQDPGAQYANVSLPSSMVDSTPLSPTERANMAIQQLGQNKNQGLAYEMAGRLRQDAQAAQPAPLTSVDTARGAVRTFIDPLTGRPAANVQPVQGGPEVHTVGRTLMDETGKILGTAPMDDLQRSEIAKNNAEAKAAMQKANVLSGIPEGVQGPDVLSYLTPLERSSVSAIVSGDQPLPSRTANPQGQRIAGLVSLVDPTYTSQRVKVKQDFSTGQSAKNIKALGTAIEHIDTLTDQLNGLHNYGGVATVLNEPANYIADKTGKAAPNNVDISANAVAGEMENAFRGSGSSITGIHEWRKGISRNLSPDQIDGAKTTALDLLESRMDALANQWNQVMPADQQRTGLDFLGPQQKQVYAKLKGLSAPMSAQGGQSLTPGVPNGVDATTWAHMTPQEQALFK